MMKQPAYITLSESTAKMMKMAAARKSMTASAYVAQLVVRDCEKSGIAALVTTGDTDDDRENSEARRGR